MNKQKPDIFEKIYFISIDPEDKSPVVLCETMNKINMYITSNGGCIEMDSYDSNYSLGRMSFKLGTNPDPDATLCYISSLSGVKFI